MDPKYLRNLRFVRKANLKAHVKHNMDKRTAILAQISGKNKPAAPTTMIGKVTAAVTHAVDALKHAVTGH